MKLQLFIALAILALAAPSARASGINLSWDDCGLQGTENKSFACTSNTIQGAASIIGSFVPPAGTTAITGEEVILELHDWHTASLPAWWQFRNAGACRRMALNASADFTAYEKCADYWAGLAQGGVAAYLNPYSGDPARARLLLGFAIPLQYARALDENTEYYAFRVALSGAKTVGTDACEGCSSPISIILLEIRLTQPPGVGDYRMQFPQDRWCIQWQPQSPWESCWYVVNPTRNSTWGAIKSQYR
ncbi:MAG: hypothetical protein U0704_03385 [Candidatus Eisenbacteria bacterium]